MRKLVLLPDADSYGATDGSEWLRTELDGGVGRYRKDKIGASMMVNVQWTLNPAQYAYWKSFYAVVGSNAFLCDLVSDDGNGPKEHTCNFIPGSVGLASQKGLTYVQRAQLEVKPLPRDADYDESIIVIYELLGDDAEEIFLSLAHLTLVTMPATIGA
jgi:hypothetical protein